MQYQSGAIISTIPPFLLAYHITTMAPSPQVTLSRSTWVRGKVVWSARRRPVAVVVSFFGQSVRPSVRPSVRQSVVHRPSGFGAAAVEGDEVTHSNAKARPSASVVCLGRTDRRSRPLGRSVGGKWWKFDVWRTSTRDDRSIADLGRIRGNSLTLRRRWSDALMQIGFGSLALRQNNSIGSASASLAG